MTIIIIIIFAVMTIIIFVAIVIKIVTALSNDVATQLITIVELIGSPQLKQSSVEIS